LNFSGALLRIEAGYIALLFQISMIFDSKAGVLNVALFGITANQWRDNDPDKGM